MIRALMHTCAPRRLRTLPASVWALRELRVLDASRNQLSEIDGAAAALERLVLLDLRGNGPGVRVPRELRERLGPAGLLIDTA